MISQISGLPANVLGFEASGRVTGADYKHVIAPAVERVLETHDKVNLLYQVGPEFEGFDIGALVEDTKLGLGHLTHWGNVALVTDKRWMRESLKVFGHVIPGKFEAFSNDELEDARDFVCH